MDIWIIRNGDKAGPFHDYEIRRRISAGEIDAETRAWHEGLPAWLTLGEIEIFKSEFSLVRQKKQDEELELTPPPPAPPRVFFRRFWARWADLLLYTGLWWLAMWAAGQNIKAVFSNPWVMALHLVPWFIVEILLIHYFGTTFGKWMMGLRVVNEDDSPLSLLASLRRAIHVLIAGVGLGLGRLSIFCQALSLITAWRLGKPLWDHTGGHKVLVKPLTILRVSGVVVVIYFSMVLQMIVIFPAIREDAVKEFPQLKEQIEKNPPWHLPDNTLK